MLRLLSRAREARRSTRLAIRFTEFAILLVALGVAGIGASALIQLQRSADDARRAELLVARVAESATNLHDQTAQAVAGGLDRRIRARVGQHRARLDLTLAALRRLDREEARIHAVDRRYREFLAATNRTLALVAAGSRQRARRNERAQAEPRFTRLQIAVETASEHYDARASEAVRQAVVGSALAVGAAALLVGLLAIGLGRRRAAREEAAMQGRTAIVRLLQAVSAASNAAKTLDEALLATLAEICAHTGWTLGHAYLRHEDGSGHLVSTGIWHVAGDRDRLEPFLHATDRSRYSPGQGVAGRVLTVRRPIWIADIGRPDSGMLRASIAQSVGIRSAFAFPVFVQDDVVAVLEFFSTGDRGPDQPLLEATAHVGFQLGYLLQRKRAETEMRRTESKYRTLVEQLPLATYIDGPEGLESTTYLSPQIEAMSGYTADEWLADKKLFQQVLHPHDRERVLDAIREATANAEPIEHEYRIITRNGRVRWWRDAAVVVRDDRGRAIYRQGYAVDVTERKDAEDRVREAEQRYRILVEQLPLATYIDALDATSSAIYMSPQIETMLGYTQEEWTTDKDLFPKLLHPDDRERVMAEIAASHAAGGSFQSEYRLLARDGRVVWIRDEAVTIRDDEDKQLFAQGYMLDITSRKEVEQALEGSLERERAANEHLRELDRLKDEFIALVSHELRTPLTSIRGYLEFLLEDSENLQPEQARFLAVVERNAERLQDLVNDLLFVAQVDAGRLAIQRTDVDLAELAADAIEAARVLAAGKHVELSLEAEPVGPVLGDGARLAQLLDNFVSNAIKFTPDGGKVEVGIRSEDERALLSIADTGIGIPEAEQAQLFERFYRASSATERAIPGTGLGLAIAKAIAEAHGGSIAVESTEGVGSTFTVSLPLAAEGRGEREAA